MLGSQEWPSWFLHSAGLAVLGVCMRMCIYVGCRCLLASSLSRWPACLPAVATAVAAAVAVAVAVAVDFAVAVAAVAFAVAVVDDAVAVAVDVAVCVCVCALCEL